MDIEVVSPIEAEAEVQRYTLVSDDIYVKRYDSSTIPDWYRTMIENLIAQDPTITDVNAALDYLTSVDNGYGVKFANLDTWQSSTNALLTTLQSSDSQKTALIADLQTTKVDATSAQAIAINTVQSYINGGSANAWFTSQVSTYASEIQANASSISTLSATLDGHTVSIDTVESIALNAESWAANASKLITNTSGQITGWSFGDGTNTKSYFDIYADNFRIVNSTYNFVPFSISGSDITFNGKVAFTNVTNPPSYAQTYYQPLAPTGAITLGSIWYDTDDNNKPYRYDGSIWQNVSGSSVAGNTTFKQDIAPATAIMGDLWIDSNDNYKVYWYSGTSWTAVNPDVATSINANTTTINGSKITTGTITASNIAANTITASNISASTITSDKIAANTITSDKIAANTITSDKVNTNSLQSALVTATYINTLSIVAGSVSAENITGTTISGKTIKGGTITGTTINASTINIRNLNTINDAGYSVMPVFASSFSYDRNDSSPYTITWTSDIYTYNSSNRTKAKTVGPTGTDISIALNGSGGFESPLAGWSVIFRYSTSAVPIVRIKTGTTIQSSKKSGWTAGTDYDLSGIGFMYMKSGSYYYLLIRSNNADLDIDSTSSSANLIIECEPGNSSHGFIIMSLTALVSNL